MAKILLIASLIVFILAIFGVSFVSNMIALGLALYVAAKLV